MNLKKLKILGVILAFLYSFLLHELYKIAPCFLTSIVAPINESIFEHMKIIFGSLILSGITQKIIVIINKYNYNNICFSNFLAAILGIFIFLIMFLPVYSIIGENLPVTLIIMLITYIIAEYISYIIIKKPDLKLENKTIFFVIITYILFELLTYFPLNSPLFIEKSG